MGQRKKLYKISEIYDFGLGQKYDGKHNDL